MLELWQDQLDAAANAPREIRVIILQAESCLFSWGHDWKDIMSIDEKESFELCSHVSPRTTIGALERLATEVGCRLVASCDLVVGRDPSSGLDVRLLVRKANRLGNFLEPTRYFTLRGFACIVHSHQAISQTLFRDSRRELGELDNQAANCHYVLSSSFL